MTRGAGNRLQKAFGWASPLITKFWFSTLKALTLKKEVSKGLLLSKPRHFLHLLLRMFFWLTCGRQTLAGMELLIMASLRLSSNATWSCSDRAVPRSFCLSWGTSMTEATIVRKSKQQLIRTSQIYGLRFTNLKSSKTLKHRTSLNLSFACSLINSSKRSNLSKVALIWKPDSQKTAQTQFIWKMETKTCQWMDFRVSSIKLGKWFVSKRSWTCRTSVIWLLTTVAMKSNLMQLSLYKLKSISCEAKVKIVCLTTFKANATKS